MAAAVHVLALLVAHEVPAPEGVAASSQDAERMPANDGVACAERGALGPISGAFKGALAAESRARAAMASIAAAFQRWSFAAPPAPRMAKKAGPRSASHCGSTAVTHDMYSFPPSTSSWYTT
jgi:hypothetical protein